MLGIETLKPLGAATIALCYLVTACAHAPLQPDRAAIFSAQEAIDNALLANSADALDRLLARDATRTGPSGTITTREQWLTQIRRGDIRYVSADRTETEVRYYGHAAVVTGRVDIVVEKPATGRIIETNRYLRVYVWQGDGWKLAAHQATAISPVR